MEYKECMKHASVAMRNTLLHQRIQQLRCHNSTGAAAAAVLLLVHGWGQEYFHISPA